MQFAIFDESGEVRELLADIVAPGAVYVLRSLVNFELPADWLEQKSSFPRHAPTVIVVIASVEGVSVALAALRALLRDIVATVVLVGDVDLGSLFELLPGVPERLADLRAHGRFVKVTDTAELRSLVVAIATSSPF